MADLFPDKEIASRANRAELKAAVAGFIKEEVAKYDIKELAKIADPMDRALSLFSEYLRSKGLADKFKGLWH